MTLPFRSQREPPDRVGLAIGRARRLATELGRRAGGTPRSRATLPFGGVCRTDTGIARGSMSTKWCTWAPRPNPDRPGMSRHDVAANRRRRNRPEGRSCAQEVEATSGFEPLNRGFADLRVKPLHHVAAESSLPGVRRMLAAPRGFEPRFTDSKSAVLPLDEGAAVRDAKNGAEDGTRTRDPHLGKVMLYQLSHFRPMRYNHP